MIYKNMYFYFFLFLILFFLSSERRNKDFHFSDVGNSLEIKFIKNGELYIKNENFFIKKLDIELLYKDLEKKNGIKYRSHLKNNQGLLFVLNDKEEYKKINMEHVKIPLDLLYIDFSNQVLYINKSLSPMRKINIEDIPNKKEVKYILEINAGLSDKLGIKEGKTNIQLVLD